jgi:hypothetical protein
MGNKEIIPINGKYPWWLPFGLGVVLLFVVIVMLVEVNPFGKKESEEPTGIVERIKQPERVIIYRQYARHYNALLDKVESETLSLRKNEEDTAKNDSLLIVAFLLNDSTNVPLIDSIEAKYGLNDDEMRLIIAEGNREGWWNNETISIATIVKRSMPAE